MSYRPKLVFCGPVATMSGYGSHARDLLTSIIEMDRFDIKVISINWGETPMNALDENNPEHKQILDLIMTGQLESQPDIWMQCTIPNEFQKVGKYNIGITAGVETDACSPEWIDGCNKMDLVIVPSKHAKYVFETTKYDKRDKVTNQTVGVLELTTPVEVLHEGVRLDIYGKSIDSDVEIVNTLDEIPNDFLYLFVGHWLRGDFGQDRKDISGLLFTFFETFGDKPNQPALLLKTSMGTFSITDRSKVIDRINLIKRMTNKKNLPKIYLLHGDLTDNQMNTLYNHPKVKAFVSFTKGEGYGRPIAEFMATGKPIIVSGWSGHTDFISEKFHTHLKGQLTEVHKSAVWDSVINAGTRWFTVNYQEAAKTLNDVYVNYSKYLRSSKLSIRELEKIWSYASMVKKFQTMLDNFLPKFAERVPINLPKLKRIEPNKDGDTK
jgi:glycosyltransferase involved in cell wall biosynthesis